MPRLAHPSFAPDCHIEVDGRPVPARAGEAVATALIAAGLLPLARSAKYHRPRGAFCLTGSCHGCLARVDGEPNRRTCVSRCRPGLVVQSQNALPWARRDVLGTIDLLFRHGLDHHHLATWSAPANRAAVWLSRRLAGTGALPDRVPPPWPAAAVEQPDAVVVGAGPAGLGAAEALARGGARTLLVEGSAALGGRLRSGPTGPADPPFGWAGQVARLVESGGGEVAASTTAVGVWESNGPVLVLRDDASRRLRLVRPRSVVLATGTNAVPPPFPRGDLPGVFDGRGLARALREEGLVAGSRLLVTGEGGEAEALGALLAELGIPARLAPEVSRAHGGRRLRAVDLAGGGCIPCDALAWFGPRAPASELARLAGAEVELEPSSGGWRVRGGPGGATRLPWLRVAGDLCGGPRATAEAADEGRRAGEAAGGHR